MKIQDVFLKGYLRTKLGGYNAVRLTPSEIVQLIIGTNGAGKSSLLAQVNHAVADRKDFAVGGEKRVRSEHDGNTYETVQYFNKKNATFEFIVNGVNLNDGHTGAVQKDLLKEHLNIDNDLIDLMTGKIRFTRMSAAQRRDWLTRISGLNLDYANALFKKVSTNYRDVLGAKKLADKRIISETGNLWSDEEFSNWDAQQKQLSHIVTALMECRNPSIPTRSQVEHEINKVVNNIRATVDNVYDKTMRFNPEAKFDSLWNGLQTERSFLETLTGDLGSAEASRKHIIDELGHLEKELNQIAPQNNVDISQLYNRQATLTAAGTELDAYRLEFNWQSFDPNWKNMLDNLHASLLDVLADKNPSDFILDWDEYQSYDGALAAKNDFDCKAATAERQHTIYVNRLARVRDTQNQKCPKCEHEFKPGVGIDEEALLSKQVEEWSQKRVVATQWSQKVQDVLRLNEVRNANQRAVQSLRQSYPAFASYWQSLDEHDWLATDPFVYISSFLTYRDEYEHMLRVHQNRRELTEVERMIDAARGQTDNAARADTLRKREAELTVRLNEMSTLLDSKRKQLNTQQQKIRTKEYFDGLEQTVLGLLHEYDTLMTARYDSIRESLIQDDIRDHQSRLALVTQRVQEQETQRAIVRDLEKQLDILEADLKAWKLLVDELSPTTGLIADQLMGFLNLFTKSMNDIINRIWTYKLEVLPNKESAAAMDYKFPLRAAGNKNTVIDVSLGSTGQTDIVDFAFVLVAMAYMNMQDYPIYADELGASFDEEHKAELEKFLSMVVQTGGCSQLWLISHAYAVQNSLGACEVCVLDSSNVAVPAVYNQHVVFE